MDEFLAAPPQPPSRVEFSGEGRVFLRMMAKGGLLQLVSLGFYRFWFVTNVRRTLWSATQAEGDALEYTGRGKELLLGFLFALAILAPLFAAYFIVSLEVERYRAFASVPLYVGLYVFGQFATFRARRYRLTRTTWRGIRFWMTGSGWSYALRSVAWALLSIATLGLAYSWREAALERYKMRNSFYGDLQGRFEGTGWTLFKASWWLWLCAGVFFAAPYGVFTLEFIQVSRAHPNDSLAIAAFMAERGWLLAYLGLMAVATALLWPVYQGIEWRWWLNGLKFGDVAFSSVFPRSRILVLYLKFFGVVLLAALVLGFVFSLPVSLAETLLSDAPVPALRYVLIAAGVVGYLLAIVGLGALYRYYLQFRLWAGVVATLQIRNLAAAAGVAARGEAANALGEGLADGLDVAGF